MTSLQPERREARINREALAAMPMLFERLISRGKIGGEVRALSPDAKTFPKIGMFRWLDPKRGAWAHFDAPGATGDDAISLVQFLAGGCEREKAVDLLETMLRSLN